MRYPSIKKLKEVFGEHAKEAREILECKRSTKSYADVKKWMDQCFNIPPWPERAMCALNQIAEAHGVEALWCEKDYYFPSYEYLNTGDAYTPTVIRNTGTHTFRVMCVADLIERNPGRFR